MRRRSPSYSPPPRRGYGGRGRSPVRGRYGHHSDAPASLLVRNIPRDSRAEDIRTPFERFGPVKDVYLPRDYYTREPRGFGFVKYFDPVDAAEAKQYMDHQVFNGREITVVFAEENRKKPDEMRNKGRPRGRIGYGGHRRSPYYARSRSRSRSPRYHSPSPRGGRRSRSYSPAPKRGHYSRSTTPARGRKHISRSPSGPREKVQGRSRSADRSLSPGRLPRNSRLASISPSPKRVSRSPRRKSRSRSLSQRDSRSPPRSPSLPLKRRQSLPLRRSLSSDSLESSHKKTYSNLTPEERSPEGESPPIMRSPSDH